MLMNRRDFLIHAMATGAVLGLGTGCAEVRPGTDPPANPFLQSNYAPVHEEITAAQRCDKMGTKVYGRAFLTS